MRRRSADVAIETQSAGPTVAAVDGEPSIRVPSGASLRGFRAWRDQHPVARSVAVLVTGTAVGQFVAFAVSPILARLYGPHAFGALGVFTALVTVVSVAATGRYELGVVIPRDDDEAGALVAAAAVLSAAVSLLLLVTLVVVGDTVARLSGIGEYAQVLWWAPFAVFVTGTGQALSFWTTREKRFSDLSAIRFVQAVATASVQVIASSLAAVGLAVGASLGQAVATFAMLLRSGPRVVLSRQRIQSVAKQYGELPRFGAPQAILNALSQNAPALALGYFYDAKIVGLYVLAQRLLMAPVTLVSQSLRQVLMQRTSEVRNSGGDLRALVVRWTSLLAVGALVPSIAVLAWGPQLFRFIMGEAWGDSGSYARWLMVWLFFLFINTPSTVAMQVLRKQKELLAYDVALLVARLTAISAGAILGGATASVALFGVVGGAFNGALVAWVVATLRAPRKAVP